MAMELTGRIYSRNNPAEYSFSGKTGLKTPMQRRTVMLMVSTDNASPDSSYKSAVDALKRFFAGDPDPEKRSIEEICVATGRDLSKVHRNREWIGENLRIIRRHNLGDAIRDGKQRIIGVQLSTRGKQVLRNVATPTGNPERAAFAPVVEPTLATIRRDIRRVCELDTNIRIEIQVTIREGATA